MSVQNRQRVNVAEGGPRVNVNANRLNANAGLAGRNATTAPPAAAVEPDAGGAGDPSFYQPSALATNSTLMMRDLPPNANYPPTCWFEPLGYCENGLNRNALCSWHMRHLLNGQSIGVKYAVMNNGNLEIVTYDRMLTSLPMPFNPSLVRVFPIIEMYNSLADLENDLNFGLLHYTLSNTYPRRTPEEVNRIVMEHKAYFMLMMEAAVSNSDSSSRNIDIPTIVRINTDECVRYVSSQLQKKSYDVHLAIRDNQTRSLYHLDLNRCTVLTQSLVLAFEQPYAFNMDLNVSIANHPTVQVADNYLVADQTKMFNGTFRLSDGSYTLGSPSTIAIFRFDTNGEISFYSKNFVTRNEKCLRANIDRKQLYEYALPSNVPQIAGGAAAMNQA